MLSRAFSSRPPTTCYRHGTGPHPRAAPSRWLCASSPASAQLRLGRIWPPPTAVDMSARGVTLRRPLPLAAAVAASPSPPHAPCMIDAAPTLALAPWSVPGGACREPAATASALRGTSSLVPADRAASDAAVPPPPHSCRCRTLRRRRRRFLLLQRHPQRGDLRLCGMVRAALRR